MENQTLHYDGDLKRAYDYNILGYHFIIIKTPKFRSQVKYSQGTITMWDIEKYLTSKGYLIIAHGADGGASSWILAIDPNDPRHIQFLHEWCKSYNFLTGALLKKPLRPKARQLYEDALKYVLEALGNDPSNIALTIWDDTLEVAFRLVNEKVRVTQDPCELLKVVNHVQPMASN